MRSLPSACCTLASMPWKTPFAVAGAVEPEPPFSTVVQNTYGQVSATMSMSRSDVFMSGAHEYRPPSDVMNSP